jgi:hypothetical protein
MLDAERQLIFQPSVCWYLVDNKLNAPTITGNPQSNESGF